MVRLVRMKLQITYQVYLEKLHSKGAKTVEFTQGRDRFSTVVSSLTTVRVLESNDCFFFGRFSTRYFRENLHVVCSVSATLTFPLVLEKSSAAKRSYSTHSCANAKLFAVRNVQEPTSRVRLGIRSARVSICDSGV